MKIKYVLVLVGLMALGGCGSKSDQASGANGATTASTLLAVKKGDLVRAAALGDVDRVQKLLQSGADINENVGSGADRICPLLAAVARGHQSVAQLLVANGAALHPTYKGYSAKELSLYLEQTELVKALDSRSNQ